MPDDASVHDIYSAGEKTFLLNLARRALESSLSNRRMPPIPEKEIADNLKENRPCFVTLTKRGALRGCIGMFEFDSPLYQNVMDKALAAALHDPRFAPITAAELKDITIEISVLTEPKELAFSSADDLLYKLKPNEDGVILHTDYGSSTFLPQVWEQLPDKSEFLSHLCAKHGAPADYWKRHPGNLRVEIYKAIHFSESK